MIGVVVLMVGMMWGIFHLELSINRNIGRGITERQNQIIQRQTLIMDALGVKRDAKP